MKYKLYNTAEEWNIVHDFIMLMLGLPTPSVKCPDSPGAGNLVYTGIDPIANSEHPDYGKYIFPVETHGKWKCDQFFPDGLVDEDPTWWVPTE